MTLINMTINGRPVQAAPGDTLLDAARRLHIDIPTLCHWDGLKPFTSCMVCVVQDEATGRLLPSCSTPAQEGLVLITESEKIREHRKTALELLLSEHVGDCEGPCQRICPAGMDIPKMMREIESDRWQDAIATIKTHIPLPAILGRICPAPCEKGCRRGQVDSALAICLLKMEVADWDLQQDKPYTPAMGKTTGQRVAVVGSGPAGLTAAYYLTAQGHEVTVFEKDDALGGGLRNEVPQVRLPRPVLEAEIGRITALGGHYQTGTPLDTATDFAAWQSDYDGVILALGPVKAEDLTALEHTNFGLKVNAETLETSIPGVFAAGASIRPSKLAVKSVGQGRQAAYALHQKLTDEGFGPRPWTLNSRAGKLTEEEVQRFQSDKGDTLSMTHEPVTREAVMAEAGRCLHCECAKPEACGLRQLAEEYGARCNAYPGEERAAIRRIREHGDVVYEPGKCIKCGICVRLTEAEREPLGLTFIGRGFDVKVGSPLNQSLKSGLTTAAKEAVRACPTGALTLRKGTGV